ncbi:hypothetical protein MN032_10775 [Agromyces atrinae]|uniref:hypothetical protein n=1 Tax=Agromyces atrinae TaxID=592376 RepID=UPI001F5AE79B|nr:hypothetical protein [Agromyces atrinae]MCI2958180.1 hypothetical protein [Agromyces atrinae]
MSSVSPGRVVGIIVGAVAILAIGLYGPVTLLGPLPPATVTAMAPSTDAAEATVAAMPADGANAVVISPAGAEPDAAVLSTSGIAEAVPIGGSAKIITLLVALDAKPLTAGEAGDAVPILAADFAAYAEYGRQDVRVLQVSPGDTWSYSDVVRAVALASSNNHADTLARFAFGSVDAYVAAANTWLAAEGYDSVTVADATGLSGDNVGTATDMARLAARAVADPALASVYAGETSGSSARSIPDSSAHLADAGVRGLSRSFTDEAGLCLLFTTTVGEGDDTAAVTGAFLRMPDYETLDPAVVGLRDSLAGGIGPVEVIAAGQPYATISAPWGATARAVAAVSKSQSGLDGAGGDVSLDIPPVTTATEGATIGRVTVATPGGDVSAPLQIDRTIRDPGVFWRLMNPVPVIEALIDSAD